jgi:hypothetical protein
MNSKDFDGIIACGDSFTYGPVIKGEHITRQSRATTLLNSWPAVLGKLMDLPVENVARQGASNSDISLQPLQSKSKFERPLIIFGFTIDHRYPYFDNDGKLYSLEVPGISDTVPDETTYLHRPTGNGEYSQVPMADNFVQRFLLPNKNSELTGLDHLFIEAVNRAIAFEYINPNATVIWGDIHTYEINSQHRPDEVLKWLNVPNRCFNDIINGLPLESISSTDDKRWQMSDTDLHPNEKGLIKYADTIYKYIISTSK